MTAAPGTHIIYVIEWKEIEYKSLVRFTSNNEVYSVDYSYKLIVPDIVSNKALPCTSDVSPAPTNTPLADLQIHATAHLPSNVELNGTLNIWDFIQEEISITQAQEHILLILVLNNLIGGVLFGVERMGIT